MSRTDVKVTRWEGRKEPDEKRLREAYTAEGLKPYRWSNSPGDVYGAHHHGYHKVIYVVRGSIVFGLPATGEKLLLRAGDRLDLPPGVEHDAVVGDDGVVCLEAHR